MNSPGTKAGAVSPKLKRARRYQTMARPILAAMSVLCVVVLLAWLAGAFHRKVPVTSWDARRELVGSRAVAEVLMVRRPRFETAVGTIKPVHEVALASKLLARVVEINVSAGQIIGPDEILVRLDDVELRARLKQLEASVDSADATQQKAALDLRRAEKLRPTSTITQAEYEQTLATLRTANAELERVRQGVEESRALLGHATIRSPIGGTVVEKRVEAGDTVVPGQVLLTMYDPQHMQMVATVRESLAQRLRVGQQLPARLESMGYECLSTISEIVPEAQATSRSFTVKVIGPCPPGVYSGMFGRLLVPLGEEQVVVVPDGAIGYVGQLAIVGVVDQEQVRRRSIQLGRAFDGTHEVLSGLRPGEKVVLLDSPNS